MFCNATAFNQDLSSWDISQVDGLESMFDGASLSTQNYDAILIGWENQDVPDNIKFSGGDATYSSGTAAEARARLVDEHGWLIEDGGEAQ